jgi:hypothetical protein
LNGVIDEVTENLFVTHEAGVVFDVAGTRHLIYEASDKTGTTDGFELASFLKSVGDCQDVYWLAFFIQAENGSVQHVVYRFIKITVTELISNANNSVFVDHECAEDGLFSFDVLRGEFGHIKRL